MIPRQLLSNKTFGGKRPARERVLDLGEGSTARASGPSFNGHASIGMFEYIYFTPAHVGVSRKTATGFCGSCWVADFAWSGRGFFVRFGSRILRGFEEEKARASAPFLCGLFDENLCLVIAAKRINLAVYCYGDETASGCRHRRFCRPGVGCAIIRFYDLKSFLVLGIPPANCVKLPVHRNGSEVHAWSWHGLPYSTCHSSCHKPRARETMWLMERP